MLLPRARWHPTARSAACELEAAFTCLSANVYLSAALGAAFFPSARAWLFGRFGVCLLGLPQSDQPGLIGFLHRTLRVNAPERVGCLAANGAQIPDGLRNDYNLFIGVHDAPKGSVLSVAHQAPWRSTSIVPEKWVGARRNILDSTGNMRRATMNATVSALDPSATRAIG
jgi:hypothetical protein